MENKILQEEKGNEQVDMSFVNLAEGTLGKQIRNESIKKNLDVKYEAPKEVPKSGEEMERISALKETVSAEPKSPEIKSVENVVESPAKENNILKSLMDNYGYYGRKMGPSNTPQETIKSGLDFERIDINEKSTIATAAIAGGGMFSVLGIVMANSVGQGAISSGIVSLISGAGTTGIIGTGSSILLGAAAIVGPILLAGGALYLGYQGLRKIKNIVNNNRAKGVFA